VLAAAEAVPGNDRAQTLEILELQAVLYGTWNKEAKARDAFRQLLTLNPEYKLSADHPPRVRTPFYEAKSWLTETNPLQVDTGAEVSATVKAVKVTVKRDVLRLVKKVRVLVDGAAPLELALTDGGVQAPVDAAKVTWRAELLGRADATLVVLGPFVHEAKADHPVAATTAVESSPPAATQSAGLSPLRTTGIIVGGVGVAGVAVGAIFGAMANGARTRLAQLSGSEPITSVTQREAFALEQQSRSQAVLANVLFAAGAGLAATGVVLFFLGGTSSSTAQLSIGPGGAVLAGVWP
jgi:hypothetical protein